MCYRFQGFVYVYTVDSSNPRVAEMEIKCSPRLGKSNSGGRKAGK